MIQRPSAALAGGLVSVLLYDQMSAFELGIVTEVFGLARPELGIDWYQLAICSERPGRVPIIGGAWIHTNCGLDVLASAQTVIVPGVRDVHGDCSDELIAALRLARQRGARLVSICSGAFALAAAGLLDGRRATTHWQYADLLAQRFPLVEVAPEVLYIDDGDVLTSAGSAAGLDLCVHLIREDYGPSVANAVARRLVITPHRAGGQAQFIEAPVVVDSEDDRISQSMTWMLNNLSQPVTVESLARRVHMSTRTYVRRFARCTGSSPIRWLITQRVHASLPLLEKTDLPVEEIVTTIGFETAVTYRHHFCRMMQSSPSAYRRAFRSGPASVTE